jgi:hypothetical protein
MQLDGMESIVPKLNHTASIESLIKTLKDDVSGVLLLGFSRSQYKMHSGSGTSKLHIVWPFNLVVLAKKS